MMLRISAGRRRKGDVSGVGSGGGDSGISIVVLGILASDGGSAGLVLENSGSICFFTDVVI